MSTLDLFTSSLGDEGREMSRWDSARSWGTDPSLWIQDEDDPMTFRDETQLGTG